MEREQVPDFSLLGGPLRRLGCRLGLVRDGYNSIRLGVVLGLSTWGVLVVMALLQGAGHNLFSLALIAGHVRLLVAVPLLFLCETWVLPRMTEFVRNLVHSGMVPDAELPTLASDIRRVNRLQDSWLAEVIFLLAASPLIGMVVNLPGKTSGLGSLLAENGGRVGMGMIWYVGFCLPLFRFLLFRWCWRLGLWCYFLWRVQKLEIRLVPTHPDYAAGLGFLEVVHEHFTPLVAAVSAVYAAFFAEDIASGAMPFEALYRFIPMILLLIAALFIGPLFLFSPKLWRCRVTGWGEYMGMASHYVNAFDQKWIRGENPTGEPLVGTPDMQSLADLTNSVNVVRNLQVIPASRRLMIQLAAAAVLPFLPLLLLKYPIDQLAMRLFQIMTGM